MLRVVMLLCHRLQKSSTSYVNVHNCIQMYIYTVSGCMKLTDVTFVLISMFSKQFSLKVILMKVKTLVRK